MSNSFCCQVVHSPQNNHCTSLAVIHLDEDPLANLRLRCFIRTTEDCEHLTTGSISQREGPSSAKTRGYLAQETYSSVTSYPYGSEIFIIRTLPPTPTLNLSTNQYPLSNEETIVTLISPNKANTAPGKQALLCAPFTLRITNQCAPFTFPKFIFISILSGLESIFC